MHAPHETWLRCLVSPALLRLRRGSLEEARRNIREAIELYLEPDDEAEVPQGVVVEEIAV
jgi:hypothetical protein